MISPRVKLVLLFALFVLPLAAAALLYFAFPEWIPAGRTNHGRLVEPARPLPALALRDPAGAAAPDAALRGKWTLVQFGGGDCAAGCRERLLLTRQVRLALNEKRVRVQRVYLAGDSAAAAAAAQGALSAEHPDLVVLADGESLARRFLAADDTHAVFLLDPLGHWVMVYSGEVQPKGLHKDLKRLLRFSQVG